MHSMIYFILSNVTHRFRIEMSVTSFDERVICRVRIAAHYISFYLHLHRLHRINAPTYSLVSEKKG